MGLIDATSFIAKENNHLFFIKAEIHKFLHILPLYGSVIDNKDGRASKGQVVRTFFFEDAMSRYLLWSG